MLILIALCEVAFWAFLAAGLIVRYGMKRPRPAAWVLAMAPAADVVLLAAAGWSLHRGDGIELGHALAAVYIGFSVAYGHRMIAWLDARFAHRFAGAPSPQRLTGRAYTHLCWADVGRTLLAACIASALTAALMAIAHESTDVSTLSSNYRWMGVILVIDLLWAISYTIWPRRSEAETSPS